MYFCGIPLFPEKSVPLKVCANNAAREDNNVATRPLTLEESALWR
jgi:hypothetical protein